MSHITINIGEPWNFEAKDGPNLLLADFEGFVISQLSSKNEKQYLLFRLVNPFSYDGEIVEKIIATPRYAGDSVNDVLNKNVPCAIFRILPGVILEQGQEFMSKDIQYFLIGSIRA